MSEEVQEYTPETAAPNVFDKIDAPITGSTDEIIKESVRDLNRKRESEGRLVRDDGPTERTWHLTTNPTLKQATDKITAEKKIELGKEYLRGWGMNPTDGEAHAVADEAAALFGRAASG